MKALMKLIVAVPVVVLSALSCNKETEPETATDTSQISISVMAEIDNLAACADTKASVAPVMRLSWANGDKVFVYDGSKCLGTLDVSIENEDVRYAYLDGSIATPAGTVLTCVYAMGFDDAPEVNNGSVTFSLAEQDPQKTPFVVYGTMPYNGTTAISDMTVNFQFATSVVLVNCLNLANTSVTRAELSGINTSCVLTLSDSAAPAVGRSEEGTIISTGNFPSGNGKLSYYIGVPFSDAASNSRNLAVIQGEDKYITTFTKTAFSAGSFKNVLYSLTKYETGGGEEDEEDLGGVECVLIGNIYWAKNNLAVTNSGKESWKTKDQPVVNVPGTESPVIVGDYFQWGASYEGYGLTGDAQKPENLVIYSDFTISTASTSYSVNFREKEKDFSNIKPTLTNIVKGGTLGSDYDAANLCLGHGWRIPDATDFESLISNSYSVYDSEDKGYYIFTPDETHLKGSKVNNFNGLNKKDAILFFPMGGYGGSSSISNTGSGYYWSSTCASVGSNNAYTGSQYQFYSTTTSTKKSSASYLHGNLIRPVKTKPSSN